MKYMLLVFLVLYPYCSYGQNDCCESAPKTECVIWEKNDTILLLLYFPQTNRQIILDTLCWYNTHYMMSKHEDTLSLYKVKRRRQYHIKGKCVEYKIKRHLVYKGNGKISDYRYMGNWVIKRKQNEGGRTSSCRSGCSRCGGPVATDVPFVTADLRCRTSLRHGTDAA